MNNQLISRIADDLQIERGLNENEKDWTFRTIYSAAGFTALMAGLDRRDDDQTVSITHIKNKSRDFVEAATAAVPEIKEYFLKKDEKNGEDFSDNLFSIYLRTGFFYHIPHRVTLAVPAKANDKGVTFYRGIFPERQDIRMSGLGFYGIESEKNEKLQPASQLFELQKKPMKDYLESLLMEYELSSGKTDQLKEYLRFCSYRNWGYWKTNPDTDGRISLAYFGENQHNYVFYQYQNGVLFHKQIPYWVLTDYRSDHENDFGEYRRIANALLMKYKKRPKITVKYEGNLVEIDVGYRLPPTEEDFFKLYSWPVTGSDHNFRGRMTKPVYSFFKNQMESIGYCFREEKKNG